MTRHGPGGKGDGRSDQSDRSRLRILLDLPGPGEQLHAPVISEPPDPLHSLPAIVRALRPLQWTKNLLVFAALIFTRSVFEAGPLVQSFIAFMALCAVSSAMYLVNDVLDAEQDRVHPTKRFRPVASGELQSSTAIRLAAVLIFAGLVAAFFVRPELAGILLAYVLLMAGYNAGLKRFVILDVIIISLGFVIRAAAGAVAISVPISTWLYICTLMLALLVGFGKRRHELMTLQEIAGAHRQNLESYSIGMLDQVIGVSAAATIVAYSVYTFEAPTLPQNHAMMLTVPIVIYAVLRYLYLLYIRKLGGSPEVLLVRDRPLLASLLIWVVGSVAILYVA